LGLGLLLGLAAFGADAGIGESHPDGHVEVEASAGVRRDDGEVVTAAWWHWLMSPTGEVSPGLDTIGIPSAVWKVNPPPLEAMMMSLSWTIL